MNVRKPKRKQKEISEEEMQIASVSKKKINNLHLVYIETIDRTTTVVLIVLQKRNYFRAFVDRQEMQQVMPS